MIFIVIHIYIYKLFEIFRSPVNFIDKNELNDKQTVSSFYSQFNQTCEMLIWIWQLVHTVKLMAMFV